MDYASRHQVTFEGSLCDTLVASTTSQKRRFKQLGAV